MPTPEVFVGPANALDRTDVVLLFAAHSHAPRRAEIPGEGSVKICCPRKEDNFPKDTPDRVQEWLVFGDVTVKGG